MKRFLLFLLLSVSSVGVFAYNESVAAISYNPSRLGAYTHLKVVDQATIKGGIGETSEYKPEINVKSKHAVSIQHNNPYNGCQGNCPENELDKITSLHPYVAAQEEEDDNSCTKNNCTTKADTLAIMHKRATNPLRNYAINSAEQTNLAADQGTDLKLRGGTLLAIDDSYINSFVDTDNDATVDNLTVTAKTLKINGDFHALDKFTFGKITIEGGDCPGTVYSFQPRRTADNQEVQILGVACQQ